MDGGRLIGQGKYGCAFSPTLYCMGEKTVKEGMVGKISVADKDAMNEWGVSQFVKTFPDFRKYYLIPETYCVPASKKDQTDPDKEKCDVLKNQKQTTDWLQFTMPLGGRALYNVPANAQNIHLWRLGSHLLEATTLLLVHGIIHSDLHINNILLDGPTQCRIIDFGMAWSIRNMTSKKAGDIMVQFQPMILHQTPEQSILSGILDSRLKRSSPDYSIICKKVIKEKQLFSMMEKFLQMPRMQMYNELKNFTEQSKAIQKEDYVSAYKHYWNKIDSWAVGCSFLVMYSQLLMDPQYANLAEESKHQNQMLKVMRGLLKPDPGLRMDTVQALQIWNPDSPILQLSDVKQWLGIVNK